MMKKKPIKHGLYKEIKTLNRKIDIKRVEEERSIRQKEKIKWPIRYRRVWLYYHN